jgi:hypothetical protein
VAKKDTVERLAGGIARDFDQYLTIADAFRATRPETRVLFLGAPVDEHRERFANEAVLAQPFTPEALARRVRGVLAAARVHLEMRILPQ